MSSVLLSNPGGLPLAVWGNPGRKGRKGRAKGSRRTVKFFVGRNPLTDPRWATTRIIRKGGRKVFRPRGRNKWSYTNPLRSRFPGWKIVRVRSVRHTNPRSRTNHMARRARSKRTGRFIRSNPGKRAARYGRARKAARKHVNRTYATSKGWVRITRARARRKLGRPVHHPAVAWSGRRGSVGYFGVGNRKGRKGFKKTRFTNPGAFIGGLTSAPMRAFNQVKSFNVKSIGFTAGGAVATYLAGGILGSKLVQPLLDKVLPATIAPGTRAIVLRVVGAALPYTGAFLLSKFVLKGSKYSQPLLLGGALASIVELIAPGKVGQLLGKIGLGANLLPASLHGIGYEALAGPVAGMGAYVEAPSYSGVGTELADQMALASYVEAPSYSGVGNEQALAGYVEAPSYSGVGDIGSYLSEKNEYMAESYLDG